jgi:hypothetical protein
MSTTATRTPRAASAPASVIETVVFPAPPFWATTAIIFASDITTPNASKAPFELKPKFVANTLKYTYDAITTFGFIDIYNTKVANDSNLANTTTAVFDVTNASVTNALKDT